MKKVLVMVLLMVATTCTMGPDVKDGMSYTMANASSNKKLTLTFERGSTFITNAKLGVMKLKITPQISVWMEDTLGKYIGTVFVTRCFGKQQWKFVKPNPDSCFRAMCMPYWLNRYIAAGNKAPTSGKPLPDAVCGATPTGGFSVLFNLPDSVVVCKLFVEWNSSFDNNETYTKESASFNGQPSVVACARIDLRDSTKLIDTLTVVGRGGKTGSDAALYNDLATITTARTIFGGIKVERKMK